MFRESLFCFHIPLQQPILHFQRSSHFLRRWLWPSCFDLPVNRLFRILSSSGTYLLCHESTLWDTTFSFSLTNYLARVTNIRLKGTHPFLLVLFLEKQLVMLLLQSFIPLPQPLYLSFKESVLLYPTCRCRRRLDQGCALNYRGVCVNSWSPYILTRSQHLMRWICTASCKNLTEVVQLWSRLKSQL